MLSVRGYRRNSISEVELWRNSPLNGELPGFGFGGFPVRSSTTFTQNRAQLHKNEHIKVRAPSSWGPKGSPTRFDQNWQIWARFRLDLDGFETVLQNSFLVSHPMLSVQSSRENCISRVELWRNRPFSGELPGVVFGVFPARSSRVFAQNHSKLQGNVHIKA